MKCEIDCRTIISEKIAPQLIVIIEEIILINNSTNLKQEKR